MIALAKPQLNSIDEVIHGEALAVLRTLPDNSVDAIVCDPPAGISFMNKTFDSDRGGRDFWIAWLRKIMAEALRVLKPGGHAFVWALPRTSHWTGMALEDAGFEVRDVITHLFGSGFPKSMDVSKAIDKMQGAEREVIGQSQYTNRRVRPTKETCNPQAEYRMGINTDITAPATPEASQWDGWGTALKPASENWYLARKPLSEKSIAENVLKWGTGAINIEASRINPGEHVPGGGKSWGASNGAHNGWKRPAHENYTENTQPHTQGRWPANLLLSHSVWCVPNGVKRVHSNDRPNCIGKEYTGSSPAPMNRANDKLDTRAYAVHYSDSEGLETVEDWLCDESCPVRLLDEQSGMRKSGGRIAHVGEIKQNGMYGERIFQKEHDIPSNEGGASRYFQRFYYVSKASRAERNRGCEGLPEKEAGCYGEFVGDGRGRQTEHTPMTNTHPTVKPLALCRYLVRMITPPGGIVLDCFAGSGSTLVAAIHEGMHFIGIEQEEEYIDIARARVNHALREAGCLGDLYSTDLKEPEPLQDLPSTPHENGKSDKELSSCSDHGYESSGRE